MQDYHNFPPIKYFIRALKTCPKSALIYAQVWNLRDEYMRFEISKAEVRKIFLMSPTIFRNLLTPLMFIGLINFNEDDANFLIELLGQTADA